MKCIGVGKSGTAKGSYGDAANGSTTRRHSSVSYSDARQWKGMAERWSCVVMRSRGAELISRAKQWPGVATEWIGAAMAMYDSAKREPQRLR